MKKATRRSPSSLPGGSRHAAQAAVNHIAVSNALLISGMFIPKLALAADFGSGFAGFSVMLWATSVARSHDPCSWERATEKNRST
jgi:hypothetical protein